jgi:hypothetical protein
MRKPLKHLVVAVGVVALAMAFGPAGAKSQGKSQNPAVKLLGKRGFARFGQMSTQVEAKGTGGPAPYHDLSGMWIGGGEPRLLAYVPPMTPAGLEAYKKNTPDPFTVASNDPWKTCDPFGMPRIVNNEIRTIGFATMPDQIAILENYSRPWRQVFIDGRQLPKDVGGRESDYSPRLYGYSVGHWDGPNTLVVETNGLEASSWVDRRGLAHSADAEVVERYTRVDHNHLKMTETLVDPTYYTKPFEIADDNYTWYARQDDPQAGTVPPFADEQICVPSQMIRYVNAVEVPSGGDAGIEGTGLTNKNVK